MKRKIIVIVLAVLIVLSFLYTSSADFTDNGQPFQNISDCGSFTTANAVYTLQSNVSSLGTCFRVLANNITLNGNGYAVRYSANVSTTNNYGITVNSTNFARIRNISILEATNTGNTEHAIMIASSSNTNISFVNAFTHSGLSKGILVISSLNTTISDSNITTNDTSSMDAYGIYLLDGTNNSLIRKNIITSGDRGLVVETTYNTTIVNNTITCYGGSCIEPHSPSVGMTIIDNTINVRVEQGAGISASSESFDFKNNRVIVFANSSNGIVLTFLGGAFDSNNFTIYGTGSAAIASQGSDDPTQMVMNSTITLYGQNSEGIADLGSFKIFKNIAITAVTGTIANGIRAQGNIELYENISISTLSNGFFQLAAIRYGGQDSNFSSITFPVRSNSIDLLVPDNSGRLTVIDSDIAFYSLGDQGETPNLNSVIPLTWKRSNLASIEFSGIRGQEFNLTDDIIVQNNFTSINTTVNTGLNSSAVIIFYNMSTFNFPMIIRDSLVCLECNNQSSLSQGGAIAFDVPGFSSYSVRETTFPKISITNPLASNQTAVIFNVTVSVTGDPFPTCFFNITRGISLDVANTQIPNCTTVQTEVSGDATYRLQAWATNGAYTNTTNRTFLVIGSGFQGGGTSGGGGAANEGAGQDIVQTENITWAMTTSQGSKRYSLSVTTNTTRTRILRFTNTGTDPVIVSLTCVGEELCDHIVFNEPSLEIPIDPEITTETTFDLVLQGELPNGDYSANLIATDANGDRSIVGLQVSVGSFGIVVDTFSKVFGIKQFATFKVPYFFFSLLTGVLVFFGARVSLQKYSIGPAVAFISAIVSGFLVLFFI